MIDDEIIQQRYAGKLWDDVQNIARSLNLVFKLKYNEEDEDPLFRWISFLFRCIEPKERFVYFAKTFWEKVPSNKLATVHRLADLFEYGKDVNPYQSRGLRSFCLSSKTKKTDMLWADWEIHHFHLPDESNLENDGFSHRSGYLVFAIVGDDFVCFLDIKKHQESYAFEDPNLVKIIKDNWPELIKDNTLKGVLPGKELDAEEIQSYRNMGMNVPYTLEGDVYVLGGGFSVSKAPMRCTIMCDMVRFEINELVKRIVESLQKSHESIDSQYFSLVMTDNGLCLRCDKLDGESLLKKEDYPRLNQVLNVKWVKNIFVR